MPTDPQMRPKYHYAPAANWLSDPNGLVHHRGEWHLFYQYNPQGEDWGHMSWGHAVSPDLARWRELPPALLEDRVHLIFSGSAVIDSSNSGGFGHDAMVAIYTGAAQGGGSHQVQCLASSLDRGRTWSKFAGNPVLDRGMADFRDPNVFWHQPSGRWIMVVALSNEQRTLIYASHDLKHWDEMSEISGAGAPGEIWECPLLIELPVEGGKETRWLFKIDVLRGAPGSGALYQTGTFDGIRFVPDDLVPTPRWQVADWGADFYAAIAWHEPRDAQGRPAWIGWMGNHAYQGRLPQQGWRGAMSLPRRLSLRRVDKHYELLQEIEPAAIEAVPRVGADAAVTPAAAAIDLPGGADLALTIADRSGRLLLIEQRGDQVALTRRDPTSPFLDSIKSVRGAGSRLTLWLDSGSIELLSADGSLALSMQHRLEGKDFDLRINAAAKAGAA